MSQCRSSLYNLHEDTRLYRVESGSLIAAELESYLAVLEPLEREINRLVSRRFAALSDSGALEEWERLLNMRVNPGADEAARRKAILHRLAIHGGSFTREGLLDCLTSAGIQADLLEEGEQLVITGHEFLEGSSLEEIYRTAREFVPAHLEFVLNIGVMTWQMFDNKELTWQELDSKAFNWEYFDIYGHLLEKEENNAGE